MTSSQQVDVLPSDLDELKQRVRLFRDHHQEQVDRVQVYLARVRMLFEQAIGEAQQQVETCRTQLTEIEQHNRMAQQRDDFQPTANAMRRIEGAEHHLSRLHFSDQQIAAAAGRYISQARRLAVQLNATEGSLQRKLEQLWAFLSVQFEQSTSGINPSVRQTYPGNTAQLYSASPSTPLSPTPLPLGKQVDVSSDTEDMSTTPIPLSLEEEAAVIKQCFLLVFNAVRRIDWEKAILIATSLMGAAQWASNMLIVNPLEDTSVPPEPQQQITCSTPPVDYGAVSPVTPQDERIAEMLEQEYERRRKAAQAWSEWHQRIQLSEQETASGNSGPQRDSLDQLAPTDSPALLPEQSRMHLVAVDALPDPEGITGAHDFRKIPLELMRTGLLRLQEMHPFIKGYSDLQNDRITKP